MEQDISSGVQDLQAMALDYSLDLIGAIVILTVGWIVAGWIRVAARKALSRLPNADATVTRAVSNLARYLVLVLVLIAVLAQFGVQTASILAVLGTAGLAIGLALQGTLSNVAAGFMLLMLRPFKIGDYVDAEGVAGTVEGDIGAGGRIEISDTARITGTVTGEAIAVAEGAIVQGIMKTTGNTEPVEFVEKRKPEETA